MADAPALKGPQPINTWLESLRPSRACEEDDLARAKRANKDEAILTLLARLALVYWRPDFAPGQAKQLYLQYVEDLREFAMADIVEAVEKYRRDGENKFFPTPGQLRGIIEAVPSWDVISKAKHIAERRAAGRAEFDAAVEKWRLRSAGPEKKRLAAEGARK